MWKLIINFEVSARLGCIPHFKLVDPVSIISAGVPVVTSLLGGLFGKSSADKQNQMNIQMQRETNELNKQMFYDNLKQQQQQFMLSNKFNAEQAALAREEGNAFTREMFNLENQYNSPHSQMFRYLGAGLNPSVAMAGNVSHAGNASANFAPNGTSATASSLGLPSSPVLQAPQATVNPISNIQLITDAMGKAAEAFVKLDQNPLVKQKFMAEFDKMMSEVNVNKQTALEKQLANELTQLFGKQKLTAELNVVLQTYRKLVSETDNNKKQGLILDLEKQIKGLDIQKMKIENSFLVPQLEATIDQMKASTAKDIATAGYTNTQNEYYPKHVENETKMANAAVKQANAAEYQASTARLLGISEANYKNALAYLTGVQATRESCMKALDETNKALADIHLRMADTEHQMMIDQSRIIFQAAEEAAAAGKYTECAALLSTLGKVFGANVGVNYSPGKRK